MFMFIVIYLREPSPWLQGLKPCRQASADGCTGGAGPPRANKIKTYIYIYICMHAAMAANTHRTPPQPFWFKAFLFYKPV